MGDLTLGEALQLDRFVIWSEDGDYADEQVDYETCVVYRTYEAAEKEARALCEIHGGEFFVATIRPERVARVTVEDIAGAPEGQEGT